MSNSMNGLVKTFKQEDTSLAKYRLVKLGTNADEVVAATADTDVIIGVTLEDADSTAGNPISVVTSGIVKVVIASASTKGGYITATTGGKGILTTTNLKKYVGILLETTTASNQVAQVLLCPGQMSV
jgi:hypothetical protein